VISTQNYTADLIKHDRLHELSARKDSTRPKVESYPSTELT